MTMPAEDRTVLAVEEYSKAVGAISGIRPPRRDTGGVGRRERAESVWGSCAAVAWLLALTPGAVIAAKFGFAVALGLAIVQAALIAIVLMRHAWETRIHLLVVGIGALFSLLLVAMISVDRSEYRTDVEQFDTTIRGVSAPGAD
jgi:hypothetical protein